MTTNLCLWVNHDNGAEKSVLSVAGNKGQVLMGVPREDKPDVIGPTDLFPTWMNPENGNSGDSHFQSGIQKNPGDDVVAQVINNKFDGTLDCFNFF